MIQFNPAVAAQHLSRVQPEGPDITAKVGIPTFPFAEPASELQREAARLHAELKRYAEAHTERVHDVVRDRDARDEAKAALDAELQREARDASPNEELLNNLALGYERAKAKATPEVHGPRVQLAYDAYIEALAAYETFAKAHLEELLEELRPQADAVAAEWQKAHERARRLLDPVEEKHRGLHQRVSALSQYQQQIRRSRVPEGHIAWHPSHTETLTLLSVPAEQFGTPPVPSPEAIAEYIAHVRPAPVQHVEGDEVAA